METLVILGLLLMVLAAAAPGLYALRRRMVTGNGPLEFWSVLQRRGLGQADTAQDPRALGVAVRRCMLCPSVDACTEWLASGAREGLDGFCPNAAYLKKLERR
jgi:hypothetical protein